MIVLDSLEFRILRKDRMKLYQHSVRCPVAMQIFLDTNPQYWRFVPMTLEESEKPEQQNILRRNITEARELPSEKRRRRRRKEDVFSSKYLVDDFPLFLLRCEDVTTVS